MRLGRARASLHRCFRFWGHQPRAPAHDSAVRPVLFAEEDFPLAGTTVIPASHQPQMLAQGVLARCDGRSRASCWLRRRAFQIFAKDVLGGARLAGDFGKPYEGGLSKPTAADGANSDCLVFGAALEDHGV